MAVEQVTAAQLPTKGLNLIPSGRLKPLADGRAIRCAAGDRPPARVISIIIDRVAIEDPLRNVMLAEFGGKLSGNTRRRLGSIAERLEDLCTLPLVQSASACLLPFLSTLETSAPSVCWGTNEFRKIKASDCGSLPQMMRNL